MPNSRERRVDTSSEECFRSLSFFRKVSFSGVPAVHMAAMHEWSRTARKARIDSEFAIS